MANINERLEQLREVMRREHLAAFIFPSTDPHQSEYVADHWKCRQWISGFDGSAGTAVVTMTNAALWTDSRYFLAAEEQLRGTEFQLMKLKMEGTPTIAQWIGEEIRNARHPYEDWTEVGIDGMVSSVNQVRQFIADLRQQGGITLRTNLDALQHIWTDRPPVPQNPVEIHPLEYAGETTASKLSRIRQTLHERHADGMLMASLDDIAWALNLRGSDVHCNPVFVSYLLIASKSATLFVDRQKLTPDVQAYLTHEGIQVDDYANVASGLKNYFEYNILLDPDEVNYALYDVVKNYTHNDTRSHVQIVEEKSPVKAMKAIKNDIEIQGFRRAMLKDGIAMVKFLKWLKPAVEAGGQTEMSLDAKLTALRAEQSGFRGISFDTICGYEQHGAIVHYEATPETDIPVEPHGLVLIDSGAQYLDGTTDITRTIALGPLSDEQRRIYTLVLRGHIQLSMCKFPDGTAGTQMDILARQYLWREGLNYLHGTGHGVGQYLNVHEGPHQFRMEWVPAPFRTGMTVTDEPGIYLAGRFGVRIENVLLVTPYQETEFGRFLQFEPLTLCPIDTTPILRDLMLDEEVEWLNQYHSMVYEELAPHLDDDERQWLREATRAL